MSFAKRLTDKSFTLPSWEQKSADAVLHTWQVVVPGVTIEVQQGRDQQIYWQEKSGMLSLIEKKILEQLAQLYRIQSKIPSFRELDYFLRDNPQTKPWPEYFDIKFIEIILESLNQNLTKLENSHATPKDWLKAKLIKTNSSSPIEMLEFDDDKIILFGKQQDAWAVEKDLVIWQNTLREIYQKPNLLLLYSIKI